MVLTVTACFNGMYVIYPNKRVYVLLSGYLHQRRRVGLPLSSSSSLSLHPSRKQTHLPPILTVHTSTSSMRASSNPTVQTQVFKHIWTRRARLKPRTLATHRAPLPLEVYPDSPILTNSGGRERDNERLRERGLFVYFKHFELAVEVVRTSRIN